MQGGKAGAVVVVPDGKQSWFPLLAAATVRSVPVAAKEVQVRFYVCTTRKGE